MITEPIIAETAALVGDPARATMVSALLDGRALAASELAAAARITPQTASTHLGKLTEAGVLAVVRHGRHRYFRLASPAVAGMIDGIVAVALQRRPRYRPLSREARALSAARICYDHLAGRLSVDLTDAFVAREYLVLDDGAAEVTTAGTRFLTQFGIALLPTLPRLDRATPTHRGRRRGCDHQALLRSRLDGADEGQPRCSPVSSASSSASLVRPCSPPARTPSDALNFSDRRCSPACLGCCSSSTLLSAVSGSS